MLKWLACTFNFGDSGRKFLYFFKPLINMNLIFVNVCFNDSDIIYYFFGLFRHTLNLLDQLTLLLHMHFL